MRAREPYYLIACEVSGGLTGYRASWLKLDGIQAVFHDRDEADDLAARLNTERNRPHSRATFRYTVIPYEHPSGPYANCRHPELCPGYCTRDPNCGD